MVLMWGTLRAFSQQGLQKVKMAYQSVRFFEAPYRFAEVTFTLTNLSNDTLYISNTNIKIEVRKQGVLLKNRPPDQAFPPLVTDIDPKKERDEQARQKRLSMLKLQFARKLIAKNFIGKKKPSDIEWLADQIVDHCLMIYPKQSISYKEYFWNKSLDKNCSITGYVMDSKVFFEFNDMGNKLKRLYYP